MTRPPHPPARAAGFTLIEAIMVIVITGIIAGVVAIFIKTAADSYFDAVRRAEMTDAADVALRRMMRDVRLALPNSLRVDCASVADTCFIEFIITRDGGRYRDASDGSTGGNALSFTSTTALTFDGLGTMPTMAAGASGDYVVVYNLGPGYEPANAYLRDSAQCDAGPVSPGCNIAQVSGVLGNTVTLDANPFAVQSPPLPSPNNRFHVVPYAQRAVTYSCPTAAAGNVTRQWGYGFSSVQPTPPAGGTTALVVANATCDVYYTPNVMQRNGLLHVRLNVVDSTHNETISVFQQIHVDNSP